MPSQLNDRTARVTPRDPWAKGSLIGLPRVEAASPGNCVLGDGHASGPARPSRIRRAASSAASWPVGTCPAGDPRGSQLLDRPLVVALEARAARAALIAVIPL